MGTVFQPSSLQIFQIAYLPLELSQKGFCEGPRPFSGHQPVDAKQSNYNSCPVRLRITRPLCTCCTLISRRSPATDRDKEQQGYRDGRQDHSDDTQRSNLCSNHTNQFTQREVRSGVLALRHHFSFNLCQLAVLVKKTTNPKRNLDHSSNCSSAVLFSLNSFWCY